MVNLFETWYKFPRAAKNHALERVEPKAGTGLRLNARQNKELEQDGDSKKSHLALGL
jgi:hypothetical protein